MENPTTIIDVIISLIFGLIGGGISATYIVNKKITKIKTGDKSTVAGRDINDSNIQ